MKKNFFWLVCSAIICCSCGENSFLQSSEMDLAELNQQYELAKEAELGEEGDDISPKIETRADESVITASMEAYITELMNRTSVAKEKVMRSAYSTAGSVVGVFKVGSCGNYKELAIHMDCEDNRDASSIEGNVGDSHVDSNGNVEFRFCLTESNRFYPGGVFLVDHIDYGVYSTKAMKVFVRHHDNEDSSASNSVYGGHVDYDSYTEISNGHTVISSEDAVLAWAFPYGDLYYPGPQVGPSGIQYGLLVMEPASTGMIHCDDEDKKNGNWAKEFNGYNFDRDLYYNPTEFGVTIGENTIYRIGISTDKTKFYDRNIYYTMVRYL